MQFDSSYITTAGSELFARATASASSNVSHPIVWGSVYTSKTDMRSLTQEEMKALTSIPENERSSSGGVTSARHDVIDGNHIVKLECEINNRQYHGSAYAIGIYAKLNSDSNEVLAAIARVDTNGSTPDIIQQSGEYLAIIDFAIAIRGDQFNIQKVDSSYYASAKSMQDLASRVVTTHVESDVTVGEDQEVYGNKYFQNGIMLNGQDGRPCIQLTDIYGRDDIAYEVSIHTIDRGLSLVAGNHLFNDTDRIFMMELDNGTALFDTTRNRASFYVPELYVDTVNTNSLVTETDSIILKSNITPSDATVTIGTQYHPFENIYCTGVHASFVESDTGEDITLKTNIIPLDKNISIGTTAKSFENIYCTNITSTRGATFNGVNAINLNGAFVNADVQVRVKKELEQGAEKNVTLSEKGIQVGRYGGGLITPPATMFMDYDKGFRFCCGPDAASSYNDASLRMSIDNEAIKTKAPLYFDEGAVLAKDKTLMLYGKVNCDTSRTEQIMLGVPGSEEIAVPNADSEYIANVPVGSIIMLYSQVGKLNNGASAIAPGEHFVVNEHDICIAMAIASETETNIPNYTYCGNSQSFQQVTGKKKIYAPYGIYVALMGVTATNADHYVTILAMRID